MAIIDTELGTEIDCDATGTFSAVVYEQRFSDKSLAKVRKAIRAAKPTVKVVVSHYDELEIKHAAHAEAEPDGKVLFRSADQSRWGSRWWDALEYDEALVEQYRQIERAERDEKEVVGAKYKQLREEVVAYFAPLTVARFEELVKAEIERRNGN